MAKNPHPYSCDECSIPKKPSNGWFLLTGNGRVTIERWSDEFADNEGTKHLCGIPCALKAAGKELEKIYGKIETES